PDLRDYGLAVEILKDLGVKKLRLLTNNPRKLNALTEGGLSVTERVAIECGRNPHNEGYLTTKAGKLGHLLKPEGEG
ncbi:MAG: GTP cyclohydrolase II, partial [Nevskiaceae bacterium]